MSGVELKINASTRAKHAVIKRCNFHIYAYITPDTTYTREPGIPTYSWYPFRKSKCDLNVVYAGE